MEVGTARFVLICLAFVATIIGIVQVSQLKYENMYAQIIKLTLHNLINRYVNCVSTLPAILIWMTSFSYLGKLD